MIKVKLVKEKDNIKHIIVKGHALYDDLGKISYAQHLVLLL